MMKIGMLAAAATLFAVGAAQPGCAADAAKSGKAEFDAYITFRLTKTIDSGAGQGMIAEADGFDRLVKGSAPFDLLTFRCVGNFTQIGDKVDSNGSCVKTDKDGDHIFYTFAPGDDNPWVFVGGTGKFKGITGGGVGKVTYNHDSGERGWEMILHHEGSWAIK